MYNRSRRSYGDGEKGFCVCDLKWKEGKKEGTTTRNRKARNKRTTEKRGRGKEKENEHSSSKSKEEL